MPTWADPERLRPRWVLWALLAVLALDLRAVVDLRAGTTTACARGTLPTSRSSLSTSIVVRQPTTRTGTDVHLDLRLENTGRREVLVAGLQAVVVEPAGRKVVGWADPARPLGLVVRPGEYGQVPLVVHLARCRGRVDTALAPGWYELVVVVTESAGHRRSDVKPVVVAP